MWKLMNIVFNIIGVVLILRYFFYKYREFKLADDKIAFWAFSRHKYLVTVGGFLLLSLVLIELILPEVSPFIDDAARLSFGTLLGIVTSFAISLIWAVYLRKLDLFDPEKWGNLLLIFLFGCGTTFLVFPISHWLNQDLFFKLNGEVINDFVYCVVGIGMVEELVKMIPLLVIVRFKRVVREPYDFLLYAAISALGFAFIENALYITRTSFFAINGRALMATVAHMTFSSVIGYGVMISVYKKSFWAWKYILGAFVLSSVMHGFYDFWLINPIARSYDGLTLIFFLITTHFWFTLKNKTINASRFFDPHRKLINDKLRFFLIFWLTALLMVSALLIGIFHGKVKANDFLQGQLLAFGFLMYYLSFSFSRFRIAPKMLNAGQQVFDAVIPKEPTKQSWGAE